MAIAHKNWAVVDKAGHQLRADAAASYLRMIAAGMPGGGTQVFRRTFAAQEALRRAYEAGRGPLAARPSWGAPHIQGIAMDNYTTASGRYNPSGTHKWMTAGGDGSSKPKSNEKLRSHEYGWYRTVPSERWHFGYNPKKDKHAAADLKARLKKLGYKDTKEFQKNNGLTVDGVAGPATWAKLLNNPKHLVKEEPVQPKPVDPIPEPIKTEKQFRLLQVNVQAQRWGGISDSSLKPGEWIKEQGASIILTCETSETRRNAIRSVLGAKRYLTYVTNWVSVMWDSTKWKHVGTESYPLSTAYHGARRVTLQYPGVGEMDVIAVHLKPSVSYPGKSKDEIIRAKLDDLRRIMKALRRKGVPCVVGGDFNTSHADDILVKEFGFTRATPKVDTSDAPGVQSLDALFVYDVTVRKVTKLNPGNITDHSSWLLQGTLRKIDTT